MICSTRLYNSASVGVYLLSIVIYHLSIVIYHLARGFVYCSSQLANGSTAKFVYYFKFCFKSILENKGHDWWC